MFLKKTFQGYLRTTKPLKARKMRPFQGVYSSMEELKEWLKQVMAFRWYRRHSSMEELKEWLKLVVINDLTASNSSMEELKEWLKREMALQTQYSILAWKSLKSG